MKLTAVYLIPVAAAHRGVRGLWLNVAKGECDGELAALCQRGSHRLHPHIVRLNHQQPRRLHGWHVPGLNSPGNRQVTQGSPCVTETARKTQRHAVSITLMSDGSSLAASIHCCTALGRSATGNSHQVSHSGWSGLARHVGTYWIVKQKAYGICALLKSRLPSQDARHLGWDWSPVLQAHTSSIRTSALCRCRMRVNATIFSPPGIFCASLYVPYLHMVNLQSRMQGARSADRHMHVHRLADADGMPVRADSGRSSFWAHMMRFWKFRYGLPLLVQRVWMVSPFVGDAAAFDAFAALALVCSSCCC